MILNRIANKLSALGINASKSTSGRADWHLQKTGGRTVRAKIRTGEGSHFTLRKSDLDGNIDILIYIWNCDDTEFYILTPKEGLDFLGEGPTLTQEWSRRGYYKWSSSTGLPQKRHDLFVSQFGNRINWLKVFLSAPSPTPETRTDDDTPVSPTAPK